MFLVLLLVFFLWGFLKLFVTLSDEIARFEGLLPLLMLPVRSKEEEEEEDRREDEDNISEGLC